MSLTLTLMRMKRIGKTATEDQIIRDLRAKYPQRRALLEELKKF